MQTKFKRHDKVKLLFNPDIEYIEYHNPEHQEPVVKGMSGQVNTVLSNGNYHVEVFDETGKSLAYVMVPEESIEKE